MIQQSHSWAYIWIKLIQKDTWTPIVIAAIRNNSQDVGAT